MFEILTSHFLPLLAAEPPEKTAPSKADNQDSEGTKSNGPHHILLTSHHLIAPSKRKDLHSLSSQLSLIGYAKTGHPGIIYAIGEYEDLVEWVREVKSWQWLALRVRIAPEPCEATQLEEGTRGKEAGARGGKGRGEWVEVEKVGEAVEWMRKRGREALLIQLGIGVGSEK